MFLYGWSMSRVPKLNSSFSNYEYATFGSFVESLLHCFHIKFRFNYIVFGRYAEICHFMKGFKNSALFKKMLYDLSRTIFHLITIILRIFCGFVCVQTEILKQNKF